MTADQKVVQKADWMAYWKAGQWAAPMGHLRVVHWDQ
jgi:hypothetical protein